MAAAVLPGACDNPEPPSSCAGIDQQTVHVGETSAVSACFEDPNGDELSYGATSSNTEVVTASASRSTVTIAGISPGDAVVTITATDPDGLTDELNFAVVVPNRPPVVRAVIPSARVAPDAVERWDLSQYFEEPDGQELTYSASSSDEALVTVAVSGSALAATGVAMGTVAMTVEASDPAGLTAMQEVEVEVTERGRGSRAFRDDFNSDASLDDWDPLRARLEIDSVGRLHVVDTSTVGRGWAFRNLDHVLQGGAEMVAKAGYGSQGGFELVFYTLGSVQLITFAAGDMTINIGGTDTDADYFFAWYSVQEGGWTTNEDLYGESSLIPDLGELVETRLWLNGTGVVVDVGGEELLSFDLADYTDNAPRAVRAVVLGMWGAEGTGQNAIFDWAEVYGIDGASAHPAPPGLVERPTPATLNVLEIGR